MSKTVGNATGQGQDYTVATGSGVVDADTQRVTLATDVAVPVSDNGGSLTVDGTVAATQSGTWTVQPGNTANTTAWKVDGSAVTQPVSGTVTATGPLTDTQLRATAVPVSGTVTATGPLTDTQLRATAVPVSGTVTANAGSGTMAVSVATAPALVASSAVIGKVGIDQTTPGTTNLVALAANQSVNTAQINGVTTQTGTGTAGTGTQRVAVASDSSIILATGTATVGYLAGITDGTASGNITTQNLVPAGTATAGSAVELTVANGFDSATIQVTGTYTGALSLQGTVDGTNWVTFGGTPLINVNTGTALATVTSALTGIFQTDVAGMNKVRVTGLAAMTGTAVVTIRGSFAPAAMALDASLPPGTSIIGALSANQSVNVAQVNGVATATGVGASNTGTQRVATATDSTIGTVTTVSTVTNVATIGTSVTPGVAAANLGKAEDAVAASGDTGVFVLGVQRAAPASNVSGTGDYAEIQLSPNNGLFVAPTPIQTIITVTPTVSSGAIYASGDVVGAANTITAAALATGRAGQITGATLIDKGKQNAALQCWIFAVSPTLVGVDNAAYDITDANLVAALPVGVIDFAAGNYKATASNSVCNGTVNGGAPVLPYVTSATANLFCAFSTTGTPTYTSTTDLVLYLTVTQF